MGVVNFAGKISAAVVLQWKGETVANALTNKAANFRYAIANEAVTEFAIVSKVGPKTISLSRKATKAKRFFDTTLNTYTTEPVPGASLDELNDKRPAATIDLTFTFARFFDALLEQMVRTDADLHNLANPNDSAAILETFKRAQTKAGIKITYKEATVTLKALPCTLADVQVKSRGKGKAPAVKLVYDLDFLSGIDAVRRQGMRKLIAADWSKLARFGRLEDEAQPHIAVWVHNVEAFLLNMTDTKRAERFRAGLVSRHKAKDAKALATDLRDDIDGLIVTANHWGQLREDLVAERHQRLLSDLFGTLHQSAWLASPVRYIRHFTDAPALAMTDDQAAALILQYGAGHCGEHATVSFSVLSEIIASPGAKITHAIRTGNANIDHAFVVYNLDVSEVIKTITTAANNSRVGGKGQEIDVWNLRTVIAKQPKVGFLMDPYLDKTVAKPTAEELLEALNSKKRKASGKDTDFLAFDAESPAGFTVKDIRGLSEAERKKQVKNV